MNDVDTEDGLIATFEKFDDSKAFQSRLDKAQELVRNHSIIDYKSNKETDGKTSVIARCNGSGSSAYLVSAVIEQGQEGSVLQEEYYKCDCADFENRQRPCKHIIALLLYRITQLPTSTTLPTTETRTSQQNNRSSLLDAICAVPDEELLAACRKILEKANPMAETTPQPPPPQQQQQQQEPCEVIDLASLEDDDDDDAAKQQPAPIEQPPPAPPQGGFLFDDLFG